MSTKGIVTLLTGQADFIVWLTYLIESLRGPGKYTGPITVLHTFTDIQRFDFVPKDVNFVSISQNAHPYWHFRLKTRLYDFTPYDETLFIDSDILARQPFEELWDMNSTFALSSSINHWRNVDWRVFNKRPIVCEAATYKGCEWFNTGVMLFKKCPQTAAIFNKWKLKWQQYEECDEASFNLVNQQQGLIFDRLPYRYNWLRNCNQYDIGPNDEPIYSEDLPTVEDNVVFEHLLGRFKDRRYLKEFDKQCWERLDQVRLFYLGLINNKPGENPI